MKQIFTLALTFLLVFTLVTVTAFAADTTINAENGTATKAVKASYHSGTGGGTVYSVDITWGSMAFTYSEGSSPTWNPATHTYSSGGAGGWSNSGNTITVTNHSNAQVTANLTYTPEAGYDGISGSFDKTEMDLATAVDTPVTSAPTDTAALTLSGTLASTLTDPTTVGTIRVTIR